MPLASPPPGSNLTDAHLAVAEALVAAELGTSTLERTQEAESGTVGSSGLIALKRPAVSVQSLTLGGAPAAGVLESPYVLNVGSLAGLGYSSMWGGTPALLHYAVTYTAGWTAEDLPGGIRQAVLLTATGLATGEGREGLKSESMGPVSRTYTDAAQVGTVPADALTLLRPWLPLRF